MRYAYSVRNLRASPELEFNLFVMLSVHEIVDALYQGKRQSELRLIDGGALRLRTSFR
jgi:hypothetical protein